VLRTHTLHHSLSCIDAASVCMRACQSGQTPFDLASENGHVDTARLLQTADHAIVRATPLLLVFRSLWSSCRGIRTGGNNQ
jgi:hypothetical protein